MADEYYSLEDVVAKLGKSAEEVTEMIQAGKLREFRDGEKLLFDTDEVDGLVDKDQVDLSAVADVMETVEISADDEVELISDDDSLLETPIDQADDSIGIEDSLQGELPGGSIGVDDSIGIADIGADSAIANDSLNIDDSLTPPEDTQGDSLGDLDLDMASLSGTDLSLGDLSALSGGDVDLNELSGADTNVGQAGTNVLDQSNEDFDLSEDSMSKTRGASGSDGSAGLGDLDADINLDSVGSGSGLLDLSLQADDTSLGAVLDDILPPAGEVGDMNIPGDDVDIEADGDNVFAQTDPATSETGTMMRQIAIAPPDAFSKACGIALLLPILAVIYAVIVVITGQKGLTPSILKAVEGLIWYIMGGIALLTVIIIGIAAAMGGKKKTEDVYQQPQG